MKKCKSFREQLSLYIDDMLTQQESLLLEKHIEQCKECREELSMLKETIGLCKDLKKKEPPKYLYPMIVSGLRKSQDKGIIRGVRKRWLKSGLVSMAAMLLVAVMVKGVIPYMGASKSADEMASENIEAPQAPGFDLAAGENGYTGNQGLSKAKLMEEMGRDDLAEMDRDDGPRSMAMGEMFVAKDTFSTGQASTGLRGEQLTARDERKIIKNADISLEVKDFNDQFDAVQRMAEETGGYVESSNSYVRKHAVTDGERELMEGNVIIRVPNDEFGGCIERIDTLGKVTNRSTYGNDITLQYMDTETRLKSKQVQQERLIEILAKADRVEDILNIENELSRVRTELESYGTQLRGWDNLVQYSTISVFMTEVEQRDTQVAVLKVDNLWSRMKRGFIRTTNGLMDLAEMIIVGTGYILPVAIPTGVIYLIWVKLKGRNK